MLRSARAVMARAMRRRAMRGTVRRTAALGLGGVADKKRGAQLPADAPALRVDAEAPFGGVEIKHGG